MDFIRNSCGNCYNIKLEKKNFKFNIYKAKITNVLISTDGGGCINELELIIVEWNPLNTDWIKMKKIVKFLSFEICKDSMQVLWVQEIKLV